VSDGKVLYLGASNYSAWQIAKGLGVAAKQGWPRFDVIQPMYSLVERQVELEILPLAREENLGVITYSPVGGGLLGGKYEPGSVPIPGASCRTPSTPLATGNIVMHDAGILASGDVRRFRQATGEKVMLRLQIRLFDPC
jgi:aryl-alcohol dehydrogenase-like predicted oxidoreductase